MARGRGTRGGQVGRLKKSQENTIAPESTSHHPEMGSSSPTPSPTKDASSDDNHTAEPPEDQLEDDEFMPTAEEVAATLVGMRSRHEGADRGHGVSRMRFENNAAGSPGHSILISNSRQQCHPPRRNQRWQ